MALETRYAARRDWPVERLVESLAALLPVRRRRITRERITFLDTFDGRVGRAGACLTVTAHAGEQRLQWRQGDVRVGCTLGGRVQFASDLPQGSVRSRIEPIVAMRRLLPLAEAEQEGVSLDLMDEARKTIARLEVVAGRARAPQRRSSWQPFQPFLTLNALRGYDASCAGPMAIIESRPGIERSERALQGHVLHAIGAGLPQDLSTYRVELERGVCADVGWLRMQHELLRIIAANLGGVLDGLDGEVLDDFRVAVRRSNSLLGQIEGVLPRADRDHLRTELAWLAQATGPVRELDLLLCGVRSSPGFLNADPYAAIQMQLEQARDRAHRTLVEQLSGERCRRLIARWQELLSRDTGGGCDAAPLVTVVSRIGGELYQRMRCGIERVGNDTPAHELDRIRVDAEDLRYLIETAAPLYDLADLAIVLRTLRSLQAALGEFDDARVQASGLRRWGVSRGEALVCAATQALADRADRRAQALRKRANASLLRFGEPASRAAFERIFHTQQPTERGP